MGAPKSHNDATRAERKAKKRKLEDAIPDLPGEEMDNVPSTDEAQSAKKNKKRKRDGDKEGEDDEERSLRKKEKKEKKSKKENVKPEVDAEGDIAISAIAEGEEAPRKSKKERKAERKAKDAAEPKEQAKKGAATPAVPAEGISKTEVSGEQETTAAPKTEKKSKNNRNREKKRKPLANGEAVPAKPARFIVFIGNLPFSASKESVAAHFAKVKPKSVRCLTQKEDPTKCKGCAFVEFDGYDHMKTCLKLFHHSMFNDGISPERKINVELTAGGGGNTQDRRNKIQEKNTKLNEQRIRRLQEEEKAKWEKKKDQPADESGIHPSRRGIVPGS
ncbi:hypothetical protein HYALB_00003530 [Hymenoscyphus albidus]|uniref:RRM domain-containing protein n=1 Tax=Hymenoscyphus albidus TaxID=595503 RepID=A0A9N9QCW9_9HELO|nr:hypothetical protein HYALB_00003530 [Hymenoscyphus albidus]